MLLTKYCNFARFDLNQRENFPQVRTCRTQTSLVRKGNFTQEFILYVKTAYVFGVTDKALSSKVILKVILELSTQDIMIKKCSKKKYPICHLGAGNIIRSYKTTIKFVGRFLSGQEGVFTV